MSIAGILRHWKIHPGNGDFFSFVLKMVATCFMSAVFTACGLPVSGKIAQPVIKNNNSVTLLPGRFYGDTTIEFSAFPMETSDWSSQILSDDITLYIAGIHGIDTDRVLIFGDFAVGAIFRSVMLRSEDGGRTWKEVIIPEELAQVSEVFFLSRRIGYAAVIRCNGGVESANLYRTITYGQTWERIGPLPNHGQGSYQTLGLRFADINHGEIWMETQRYDRDENEFREFCLMKTTDGGVTWFGARLCCHENQSDFSWLKKRWHTSLDGTQWQNIPNFYSARVNHDSKWIWIRKRRPGAMAWKTMCAIPKNYRYDNGHFKEKRLKGN